MAVPASVKQLLEQQNVAYTVSIESAVGSSTTNLEQQRVRGGGVARSVILSDSAGWLQVVFPADCLLDISAVNHLLERSLRALAEPELRVFYGKHKLDAVPALPRLGGIKTLVDQRLLGQELVLLDSGSGDILQVSRKGFAALAADSVICDVAVPLQQLEARYQAVQNDEADIFTAVRSFTSLRIKQRLEETLDLPPLPETAQRIIKLRVDPAADINDLAEIVEIDPSLAAQVVSWAASPYYSAPGKIKSIHDAIVRVLGFDMVLNLALGLALGRTLGIPDAGPMGATPFWRQAVYTAATVEGLVTAIPREHRPGFGMAYLSGLLHNFGWLVLAEVFPPHFTAINRCIEANSHASPHLAELNLLGVSRDQLASWLLHFWNMPDEVVVALRYQNMENVGDREHGEYAKLLLVAQRLLQQRGIGQGPQLAVPDHIYAELHLDPDKARQALDAVMESVDNLDSIASQLTG
ncbi:HDOD domain-containing protein [Pseudomaricurvus alcaniphilus]|uniref:aminoacyl-tRNA deacylase and HDOD domain-containing protein n=1 Tax=Pseudomaricurvus alcaniphilus TaxID=1166482 RepID=UPI001408D06B|nr:HDOD domain-containing protein [Pseudomaricurvus alcaniphilus]NHN38866.1 HDOD domain-containing protein [Pseudomaricurvus alcaniphilus]